MSNFKQQSLAQRFFVPQLLLSIGGFIIFGAVALSIVFSLVDNATKRQAVSSIDIFKDSIREDLLTGLEKEVFSKCQSMKRNTIVNKVFVSGFNKRIVCDESKEVAGKTFKLARPILFNPKFKDAAGIVEIEFSSSLGAQIVKGVTLLVIILIFILLVGYWLLSNYFIKNETGKFTLLANMLSESDMDKLEKCGSYFDQKKSHEFQELCNGVEKLSSNWKAYQAEQLKNERLKVLNETSRILAHDMKSPIGALKIVNDAFESKSDVSRKLLEKSIKRIEALLEKIVTNKLVLQKKTNKKNVDLDQFFNELFEDLKNQYQNKFELHTEINLGTNEELGFANIDSEIIERAILNLVKNSSEAVDPSEGQIEIVVRRNEQSLEVRVSDNGTGIPAELLDKLGKSEIGSTKNGGTGLGLLQVDKAVRSHGGELQLSSLTGRQGTIVLLNFPYLLKQS